MKPFNREKFLLFMLAGIFIWQAAIFTYGVIGCFQKGGREACPSLGDRYESTVNVMVATTLALLGAGAVASVSQKKSSSDRALLLDEQPRQLPRRRSQEKTFEERAQGQEQVEPQEQASSQASASEKEKKQLRDKR